MDANPIHAIEHAAHAVGHVAEEIPEAFRRFVRHENAKLARELAAIVRSMTPLAAEAAKGAASHGGEALAEAIDRKADEIERR